VVVRRSPWEEATEFVLVFAAGINDSLTYDTGKHFSSLERYIQDLEDLLAVARLFSDKLLFIGLTPVDDENPRTRNYHTERIWQFEQVLRRFTQNHALPFVPLFEKLQARMHEEYVFIDGLHPSDEGHQLIYEQVLPVLQSLAVDTPAYTDILGA
jgi:lysophospholipase L1-like esterase